MQRQERNSQETTVQPWGRVLVPPQGIHTISLSSSAELKPPPNGRCNFLMKHSSFQREGHTSPTITWSQMISGLKECGRCRYPDTYRQPHPLDYKTPHYPLQVRTHGFEGISPLWPPLSGKGIKLFFSTSPKTLSPRFNSVSGYRGWIWLRGQCNRTVNSPEFFLVSYIKKKYF